MELKDLAVGDKVWISYNGAMRHNRVERVKRFTKTMIVTENGNGSESKFYLDSGRQVGSSDRYTWTDVEPFTEEHQKIIEAYKLKKNITDTLDKISALNKEGKLSQKDLELLRSISQRTVDTEK